MYQRMVIRFTQPLFVTGSTYVFIKFITTSKVGIVVTVVLAVAIAGIIYWRTHRRFANDLQKVAAINSTMDMYYVKEEVSTKDSAGAQRDDSSDSSDSSSTSLDPDEDLSAPTISRYQ